MASDDFGFKNFSINRFYTEQNAYLVDMVEVGSGQCIVDLACGTGGVTRIIADRLKGARDSAIIGIDHSSSALKQAMEDLKDVRDAAIQFVQSGVENISEIAAIDYEFFESRAKEMSIEVIEGHLLDQIHT